ncbi:MAG TPA: TRAP transporter small permease [Usitatibacter sp.]|nr:TRAP transporter small permease [Usitatibacter sp.]
MRLAWLERLEEGLIALLLAVMTIVSFVQVVARYVFNYSFTSALELTTSLFAWLIFLGIPYGVRIGSHIGVDALVRSLGRRAGRVVGAVGAALCLVYSVILLYGSWAYVGKMYDIGIEMEDLPVQQWIPRAILIVSFALLVLRFSQVLWRILSGREVRLHLGDEAAEALRAQHELMAEPGRAAQERK